MTKLTLEISDALSRKLARAAMQRRVPTVALVREAITEKLQSSPPLAPEPPDRMWDRIKDICGSVDSGRGDLSTNKAYLKRMGREKYPY